MRKIVTPARTRAPDGGRPRGKVRTRGGTNGPLELAHAYLRLRDEPKEIREDVLRREGTLIMGVLERRLRSLAVLAQVGTLLGLLGTFYFMIYRFNPEATAGGVLGQAEFFTAIWESFLSTMFGLVIAIPCTVAYLSSTGVPRPCRGTWGSSSPTWTSGSGRASRPSQGHRGTRNAGHADRCLGRCIKCLIRGDPRRSY